jgi:hypothetical protein
VTSTFQVRLGHAFELAIPLTFMPKPRWAMCILAAHSPV